MRLQQRTAEVAQETDVPPSEALKNVDYQRTYQRWLGNLLTSPSTSANRWSQLPIADSAVLDMPIPSTNLSLTIQLHNTLIFYLTSSTNPTLPTLILPP